MKEASPLGDGLGALAASMVDLANDVRRRAHERVDYPELPNTAIETLRLIERHPGISVAELAAKLGRQVSNVSTGLRELDARDLIVRERDPEDKRIVTLQATERAVMIKHQLEEAWGVELEAALAKLSPVDARAIRAALPAIVRLASVSHTAEHHPEPHTQH